MAQSVKHKRSAVLVNGSPKLPTTSQLEVGEIAINFAEGHETLSTRNNNNGIATFSSDAALDKKYISSGAVVSAISAVTQTIEDNEYVIAQAFNDQDDRIEALEGAGFLTGYTETDPTVPAWAKTSTKPTYTANEVGALPNTTHVPTEASIANSGFTKNALTAYTETDPTVPAWAKASSKPTYTASEVGALSTATTYFDDVEYDSSTKRINFKKNNSVIDYVDATDFIKDGMVSSVTVSNGNLVVSFNTEAGREDITLALTQIFNPNNYYDKTTADGKFLTGFTETDPTVPAWAKADNKPTYTASEVGALPTGTTLDNIADGSTRKLSNYSLTSHTHNNYSLTSHTHTAAEVGALPSTTEIPTQASIAGSGFTKNGNVQSNWTELDQTADSYILNSPVFSATGALDKVYGIRTNIIDGGDGYKYFFPDGDGLWMAGYNENNSSHKILITDDVIKSARIPGDNELYSASSAQYGLVKIGNFLTGNSGFISVATGTNSTTVARGDHSHTGMLTGVTINGSAATVSNGNASFNIELGGSGSGLPTVSASDNGKILQVVDGQWQLVTPTVVYTGNGTPDNLLGNNGDIYLQTS